MRGERYQILALQQDLSAVDRGKPRQTAQQRRFTAAARPEQRDKLALLGGEVDILKHLGLAIVFIEAGDIEVSHAVSPYFCSANSPTR